MSTPSSPSTPQPPSGAALWFAGARPRTLPAAVVPVVVGSAVAIFLGDFRPERALLALVVSLALQVGVNYANDYSDGIRGTDDVRVGPIRLVGSKLVPASSVKRAAFLAFAVAAIAGLVLSLLTSPLLILVGLSAILAGWFYTGGPRPYGYAGLGEVFVFVYFGIVAVMGTAYVQTESISALSLYCAIPIGCIATALLVVNNLRDIPGDTRSGKRTLAVRLGDPNTRTMYLALLGLAFGFLGVVAVVAESVLPMLAVGAIPVAAQQTKIVRSGAKGRDLIALLGGTGRLQLIFGVLLSVGLALASR